MGSPRHILWLYFAAGRQVSRRRSQVVLECQEVMVPECQKYSLVRVRADNSRYYLEWRCMYAVQV